MTTYLILLPGAPSEVVRRQCTVNTTTNLVPGRVGSDEGQQERRREKREAKREERGDKRGERQRERREKKRNKREESRSATREGWRDVKDAAQQERGSMTREEAVHQARWKGGGALFLVVGAPSEVVSSGAPLIQQPTLFLAEW